MERADAADHYTCRAFLGLYVPASVCVRHTAGVGDCALLIEMPFGGRLMWAQRNYVLDGVAHWRHLANTIDRSVWHCCMRQCRYIAVTTCFLRPHVGPAYNRVTAFITLTLGGQ